MIVDYQITHSYLKPKFASTWKELPKDMLHLFDSHPESIQHFIAELEKNHQSVELFLEKIGVTKEAITKLKDKFIFAYKKR